MPFTAMFVAHAPDADPQRHKTLLDTGLYRLFAIVVKDQEQSVQACRTMVADEGVQSILLCPGHTHQDVATVASQARVKLQVGGPAAAMFTADPTFIRNYVAAIEQADLPIDFVSFHWYANYPCL